MPRSSGTSSNPQTVPRRISAPAATSGSLVSNCYCFAFFYNPGKNTIDIASTDRERESSHAQQEQDHERRQIAAKAPRRQEKIKINHKQTHTPPPAPNSSAPLALVCQSASAICIISLLFSSSRSTPVELLPLVGFLPAQGPAACPPSNTGKLLSSSTY